jgi:putative transport protein
MEGVSKFFGDSYRALAEVDLLSFCLGLALGLLLGSIPIPLPGGSHFKLGFAGGPLVMALILGRMRRTGKIVWSLPYSANLTLRQFGLLLFSAGIGTRAGFDFFNTLSHGEGMNVFLVGLGLTAGSGVVTMLFGYYALKIPLNVLFGVYAGAQTQPVSLGFAVDQTKNDLATGAYSVLFPIATIYKIIITQMLLLSLGIPPATLD